MGFKWKLKTPIIAQNAIFLEDSNGKDGRPFKARFLQPGLVKYDFGVCLLTKETIDKFINTFIGVPIIIDHKDDIAPEDENGKIQNIWFSPEDGWYWCSGILSTDKAVELVEDGYNVSCQYAITEYIENLENKLHNGNPYDKEILNGLGEHLAIVKNPRYEGAFIAANAFIAKNAICQNEFKENEHPRDDEGKFTKDRLKSYYNPNTKTIELNGHELGFSDDEIRENGLKYYKTQLQGRTFKNKDLGEILFSRVGLNKLKSNSADINKIKAIPALKDIVEQGTYKGTPEEPEHERNDGIIKFHRINHDVSIDGKKDNMSVLIGEDRDGNRFYNLNNTTYEAKNSLRVIHAKGRADNEFHINIIASNSNDFNPIDYINELDKGGQMDEKLKELCAGLVNAFMKAKNEADKEKEKMDEEKEREEKEKEAENKAKNEDGADKNKEETASNEDVDKRKNIREVEAALFEKGLSKELVYWVTKLMEENSYNKSEAGTADNKAKNKCKNEDDTKEDEYEELKEKIYEEVKNQIAKNSMDSLRSVFYQGSAPQEKLYVSQKEGIERGKQIYG